MKWIEHAALSLVKLDAPAVCLHFTGIIHIIRFSIFMLFQCFRSILGIFHIQNNCFMFQVFWNIPYPTSHVLCFWIWHNLYLPQKTQFAIKNSFLNIPVIFHIPKIWKGFLRIYAKYLNISLFWNIQILGFSYSKEYSMGNSLLWKLAKFTGV